MEKQFDYDAVVVGSGPNGLSAANILARAGLSVAVLEAARSAGGGARSAELTLPGFTHDICSAVHPLGATSPVFRALELEKAGLTWLHPQAALAHPLDDGSEAVLLESVEQTAATLGEDASRYRSLVNPFVARWHDLQKDILGPARLPSSPVLLGRFGFHAIRSAQGLIDGALEGDRGRALLAGCAAHSGLPLGAPITSAIGLVLAIAGHAVGWPVAAGGSQAIINALLARLAESGGTVMTDRKVSDLDDLPPSRATLMDITPRQFLHIAGDRLHSKARNKWERFRYGMGCFKIDWALDGPIPFSSPWCRKAATVHIGGAFEEIVNSEQLAWDGKIADRPFVLLAQQSVVDRLRAPEGKHTAWAYCHVPHNSDTDMTAAIEAQIERFAPGFRDRILARHTRTAREMENYNSNYVGGDINGGSQDWRQLFSRPVSATSPYRTPIKGVYLCSSSTPPGGGVHGMCGYHAAAAVLRDVFGTEPFINL